MLVLLAALACDRSGEEYVPQSVDGYDGVLALPEITPVSTDTLGPEAGRIAATTYASVTLPRDQLFGGATATFVADGGAYCVLVDPEAVTWNQSVDLEAPLVQYSIQDNTSDDGDLDLSVGLSSNYTGTPDLEMGNFEQAYEDSLGNQVTVNTNECVFFTTLGQAGAHGGRATPEFCDLDTTLHPNREYTIALDTWSLPLDDDLLSFGLMVVDGSCQSLIDTATAGDWECVIPGESCSPEEQDAGNCNDRELQFRGMELAYCGGSQNVFCDCSANPSADNPACNSCSEGGSSGYSFADGQLTVTTYDIRSSESRSDCTDPILDSVTVPVDKLTMCEY